MDTFLYRLGKSAAAHRWWFIAVWALIVIAVASSALSLGKGFKDNFELPGTPGQEVLNDLEKKFPDSTGGLGVISFSTSDGKAFTAEQRESITSALEEIGRQDTVQAVANPFEVQQQLDGAAEKIASGQQELDKAKAEVAQGQQQLDQQKPVLDAAKQQIDAAKTQIQQLRDAGQSAAADAAAAQLAPREQQYQQGQAQYDQAKKQLDEANTQIAENTEKLRQGEAQQTITEGYRTVNAEGDVAYAQVVFTDALQNLTAEQRDAVKEAANTAQGNGVEVNLSQEIVQEISLFGPSEAIGVAVAVAVLLIMLGTLIAAGLPLLMALVGVAVGVGGTYVLTAWVEMGSMTSVLGLMLGLAVGIDYSLFIVNRHRNQLLGGMDLRESIARAIGTSGNAVLFAGITVIIALIALAVPGIPFLSLIGYSGAATVAVAVLVAITLTPALLSLIGTRILSKRQWAKVGSEPVGEDGEVVHTPRRSWANVTTKHPWLVGIATIVVLGVAAIPAASLRLALPDGGFEPAESTAYKSYKSIEDNFGAGYNAPLLMVVDLPQGSNETTGTQTLAQVATQVRDRYDIAAITPGGFNADYSTATLRIIPTTGPSDEATEKLVQDMRTSLGEIGTQTDTTVKITGVPVIQIDVSEKLTEALPVYLSVVVGLSLVLMLLVFRSILVPIVATIGFVLTIGATFGAVVAVYSWGWLPDLFGVHNPGPILSFAPLILTGVLFGLAMDYQMFLVSGMRESFVHGAGARQSVVDGFNHGSRVVTAAAIIMISVFAGFIFAHLAMVRPLGLGLAFGVLVDAFIVRMTFTPAVMTLLGKWAWWIPRWLDRILPDVDVEGAKLSKPGANSTRGRHAQTV